MRVPVALAALSALLLVPPLLAPPAAEAATLSYSQFFPGNNNLDPSRNPQSFATTDWEGRTQYVTLPRFDPARGTLTGVDLFLYGNIASSGSLANTGTSTVDIDNYAAALEISVLTPDGDSLLTVSPALFNISNRSVAAGQSISFGPVNSTDSGTVPIASVAPYVGTDNISFPLFTRTDSSADITGGNLEIVQDTRARAEVTITYTYDLVATAVPEPASALLLGAGLLGLGLLRRRP